MGPTQSWVALGVIVRPHGVRGGLLVKLYNPNSELIFQQVEVVLTKGDFSQRVRIEHLHPHREGMAIMTLAECSSRTQAELFRGYQVCVDRAVLPALSPGEYYHADLIGLDVVERQGNRVGTVVDVVAYPTVDSLRVVSKRGHIEIPMLDPFLVAVDINAGRIIVDALDDLDWERPKSARKGQ